MASLIRPALQLMVKDGGSQNLFCVEYGVFSGDLCTVRWVPDTFCIHA